MQTAQRVTRKAPPPEAANRVVLRDVDWKTYRRIGEALLDRPIRMTYCEGVLEIMTLSPRHEGFKKALARLVEFLLFELRIRARSLGSMTMSRDDLEKGMEADECYWIASAEKLEGRLDIDLNTDPPPDLALEIEVSSRLGERWKILAALKVGEVWSWDGETVLFHVLKGGKYQVVKRSRAFPFLTSQVVTDFTRLMLEKGELEGLLQFQEWLRQNAKRDE